MSAHAAQGVLRPGSPSLPKYQSFYSVASSTGSGRSRSESTMHSSIASMPQTCRYPASISSDSTTHSTVGLDSACSPPYKRRIASLPKRHHHAASIRSDPTTHGIGLDSTSSIQSVTQDPQPLAAEDSAIPTQSFPQCQSRTASIRSVSTAHSDEPASTHGYRRPLSIRSDATTHSNIEIDSTYASEIEQLDITPCRTKPSARLRALGFGEYVSREVIQHMASSSCDKLISPTISQISRPQSVFAARTSRDVTPPNALSSVNELKKSVTSHMPPSQSAHAAPAFATAALSDFSLSSSKVSRSGDIQPRNELHTTKRTGPRNVSQSADTAVASPAASSSASSLSPSPKCSQSRDIRIINETRAPKRTHYNNGSQPVEQYFQGRPPTEDQYLEGVTNEVEILQSIQRKDDYINHLLAEINSQKIQIDFQQAKINTQQEQINSQTTRMNAQETQINKQGEMINATKEQINTQSACLAQLKCDFTEHLREMKIKQFECVEEFVKEINSLKAVNKVLQEKNITQTSHKSLRMVQTDETTSKIIKTTQMSKTSQRISQNDDKDITIRPSTSPQDALARVLQELEAELEISKLQLAEANKAYENHDHSKGRRVGKELKKRVFSLMEAKAKKGDQIYDLYDVAEAFV